MERLVKLISLCAAGSFVISTGYLLGYLVGLRHLEISEYLVAADVVNVAVDALGPVAVIIAVLMLFDHRLGKALGIEQPKLAQENQTPNRLHRWSKSLGVGFFIGTGGLFIYKYPWAAVVDLLVIVTVAVLIRRGKPLLATAFGINASWWWDISLSVMSAAICIGVWLGTSAREGKSYNYLVSTAAEPIAARTLMPIDRGILLFAGDTVRLLPWSEVKGITQTPISEK